MGYIQMLKLKKPKTARVRYNQGITITKNYQSMRVDAGIELDCSMDSDDIKETFGRAKKLVEKQLELAVQDNKTLLGELSEAVK